jgi:hypothetical protein
MRHVHAFVDQQGRVDLVDRQAMSRDTSSRHIENPQVVDVLDGSQAISFKRLLDLLVRFGQMKMNSLT